MDFRHYTDSAAALAAGIVNVFAEADEEGREARPEDLTEELARHEAQGSVTAADVAPLRAWAERLRTVFEAPDAPAATAAVNALLAETRPSPHVSEHDGEAPHLHFARPEAGVVERTAASTAMGLAVVLCDYGFERLGICAASSCEDTFIDTSRNAQRRYCSQGCANRSNVAAHRARARNAAPGAPGVPGAPGA